MSLVFTLASGNQHKAREFAELFDSKVIQVEAAPEKVSVDESGESFQQNAFLKAEAYFKKFQRPTMADDSGLVVEERPNILGIHSARYAPETDDYQTKCEKLIQELSDLEGEHRRAYFVCYLCFYLSPNEVFFFEGRLKGEIGQEYRGSGGFGYDPIFLPETMKGKTLAELSEWKQKNSHRAKAAKMAQTFFRERDCQKSEFFL
jgi:XTP/dITP diphosphohydrolase